MDILIIDPPHAVLKELSTDRAYNVGPVSLAAYLRQGGIDSAVLMGDLLMDFRSANPVVAAIHEWRTTVKSLAEGQHKIELAVQDSNHEIWKKVADAVRAAGPRAVGIPYLTPMRRIVEKVARLVKEIDPDITVIAGSFHPTFRPFEVMQNPDIDFIVSGEGEIPLLALMKELKKDRPAWEKVPGIYYREKDGQVKNTPHPDLITNLDELPLMARDLVLDCDYTKYRIHDMSSARGCPYSCAFCADRNFWNTLVRRRSVDSIIDELEMLQQTYPVDAADFVDGTFTFDRKYLEEFCRKLIDRDLKINWRCTARFDNLDEDLLKLMKQSNCTGLYFGLESGSDKVLKSVNKRLTMEQITEVSKMVRDSGIPTVTSVLFGLPDEDKEDLEATLRVMKDFPTDFFDVNSYLPLPGSPLFESVSDEEWQKIDWGKVAYKSFENYFTKTMSQEEAVRYQTEAYKIADRMRRRGLLRLGYRMLKRYLSRIFHRGGSSSSFFSYS